MGLLDSNIFKVKKQSYFERLTYTLGTRGVIKEITTHEQYSGVLIDVLVPNGCDISVIGVVDNLDNRNKLMIYDINGNIIDHITKSGLYYVDSYVRKIQLYNNTVVTGSANIALYSVENPPAFVTSIKPIQLLSSTNTTVSGSTRAALVTKIPVKDFKFVFVSLLIRDSAGKAKSCNFVVQSQHYVKYADIAVSQSGSLEDIDELTSVYSYQSKWLQVRGDELTLYIKPTLFDEGTVVYCNLYGVR